MLTISLIAGLMMIGVAYFLLRDIYQECVAKREYDAYCKQARSLFVEEKKMKLNRIFLYKTKEESWVKRFQSYLWFAAVLTVFLLFCWEADVGEFIQEGFAQRAHFLGLTIQLLWLVLKCFGKTMVVLLLFLILRLGIEWLWRKMKKVYYYFAGKDAAKIVKSRGKKND